MLVRFALIGMLLALAGVARAESNNLWVMWERVPHDGTASRYRSHLMFDVPRGEAEGFFTGLEPSAQRYGTASIAHDRSPICTAPPEPPPPLTYIDTNGLTAVSRADTLRGLAGVHVDLRGVRGPAGYRSNFGEDAHAFLLRAFAEADIPILTKDDLDTAPGRPILYMRYSAEVSGCRPWSVSLSLRQQVVLARDLTMMLETVTWSGSARQSEEDIEYGPGQAVEDAIKLFVTDYSTANPDPMTDTASGG